MAEFNLNQLPYEIWSYYLYEGICGLCGQTGIIDNRGTIENQICFRGTVRYCICPNGRQLLAMNVEQGRDIVPSGRSHRLRGRRFPTPFYFDSVDNTLRFLKSASYRFSGDIRVEHWNSQKWEVIPRRMLIERWKLIRVTDE